MPKWNFKGKEHLGEEMMCLGCDLKRQEECPLSFWRTCLVCLIHGKEFLEEMFGMSNPWEGYQEPSLLQRLNLYALE